MDDDIWEVCDDAEYDRVMSERNFNRMNEINQNMGYIQGMDLGKEHTIQKGFETGFKIGFDNGSKLGEQFGELSALKFLSGLDKDNSEKVDSILKQFDEKYSNFRNVESLYEVKEEKLKEITQNNNDKNFIPDEIKSFYTKNQETLNSITSK